MGLVTVTESESLDLDMIDDRDHSRIMYMKVNASTGREVPDEHIVKVTGGKGVHIHVPVAQELVERAQGAHWQNSKERPGYEGRSLRRKWLGWSELNRRPID